LFLNAYLKLFIVLLQQHLLVAPTKIFSRSGSPDTKDWEALFCVKHSVCGFVLLSARFFTCLSNLIKHGHVSKKYERNLAYDHWTIRVFRLYRTFCCSSKNKTLSG